MVVAAAAFTFASCSSDECCDCGSVDGAEFDGGAQEVCEDDVNSDDEWNFVKSFAASAGCDCD